MEERGNVKWILIISLAMFFISMGLPILFLYGSSYPAITSRIDALFFLATITVATLYTTGFGKKELMYRLAIYLFIFSMGLFFLSFIGSLFTFHLPPI